MAASEQRGQGPIWHGTPSFRRRRQPVAAIELSGHEIELRQRRGFTVPRSHLPSGSSDATLACANQTLADAHGEERDVPDTGTPRAPGSSSTSGFRFRIFVAITMMLQHRVQPEIKTVQHRDISLSATVMLHTNKLRKNKKRFLALPDCEAIQKPE
eukprot:1699089-Rhodomonas_salina.2